MCLCVCCILFIYVGKKKNIKLNKNCVLLVTAKALEKITLDLITCLLNPWEFSLY